MKKFLALLIVGAFLALCGNCFAGTETLTFMWEKDVIEADLSKFGLQYTVDDPSIENPATPEEDRVWTHLLDVTHALGDQGPFMSDTVLTSPDGQEMWYWFRICAVDDSGNASDWCYGSDEEPECKAWIDFKAPGDSKQFTVIVGVEPGP